MQICKHAVTAAAIYLASAQKAVLHAAMLDQRIHCVDTFWQADGQLDAQVKNGTAYLVRSIGAATNDHIGISRLAPDYLDTRCVPAVPVHVVLG